MRQLSAMGSPWISSKDEVEVVVLKVVVVSSQVMGLVLLHGMVGAGRSGCQMRSLWIAYAYGGLSG